MPKCHGQSFNCFGFVKRLLFFSDLLQLYLFGLDIKNSLRWLLGNCPVFMVVLRFDLLWLSKGEGLSFPVSRLYGKILLVRMQIMKIVGVDRSQVDCLIFKTDWLELY